MGERGGEAKKVKWPSIKPKKNLQITHLKETHLFTIPNFLSTVESRAFIKVAESIGFAHQGSLGPTRGEAYRDNHRFAVEDPVLAATIWESGLKKVFADIEIRGKVAVGLNPNIRFYRYNVGQRFGRHIDESVDLVDGSQTYYTLLIYLSGGSNGESGESLVGGETVFYGSRRGVVAEVAPVEGMALLHIHGDKWFYESVNGDRTSQVLLYLDEMELEVKQVA
ncbi:2-oxoglutarate (2OG) and Fe(II)-dependent oxygenase superfamily protein [Thalictrum thalictroides]|uniref:2-oxoglutarate (2OG) and Fe(II)-dependent oxygenase superfamily protein n=1 Tax=Thalictrum thalictroides TaxID=46969 RepID=A0A7J6VLU4_THATH|nr:2-oxoglutarate (2OG) and Fe(II)-dependent oxygenase superfamily protein [Thalictrum thalictroides]